MGDTKIDIDALLADAAFNCLSEHEKQRLREVAAELEGKNLPECLPVLRRYSKAAEKSGKTRSKEEQRAMLAAFTAMLPNGEKTAVNAAAKLFGI